MSLVQFRCPSCTRMENAEPRTPNESLFVTKERLRCAMGETCPRAETTAHLCPMRKTPPPAAHADTARP